MRRRRMFLSGFVACIEGTRLSKCVMLKELLEGAGYVGGAEKRVSGDFLDDLRAFSVNADQ